MVPIWRWIEVYERHVNRMLIMGYYDGTVVCVNEQLRISQKVIVIPTENEEGCMDTIAGEIHKYAVFS